MFLRGAAPVVVFRTAGFAGMAAGVEGLESEGAERGDFGRDVPLPLPLESGLRKGDAERGVPVREGGLEGRLMVGLSQDEKKSSSLSAGVLVPSEPVESGTSVITTSSGYLIV
jgi:hypothetical protein